MKIVPLMSGRTAAMPSPSAPTPFACRQSWLASAAAVAATYIYFLIFAEFSFLELVRAFAPTQLRLIMLALGAAGIAGAVLGAVYYSPSCHCRAMTWSFRACALSAGLALLVKNLPGALAVAGAVGLSLGWLTVTLTAGLKATTGGTRLGLCVGVGTGVAYALCNLPVIFASSPKIQTIAASLVAVLASFIPHRMSVCSMVNRVSCDYTRSGILRWVVVLLALVWMDSAAFFIVQHSPALFEITWLGTPALLVNSAMHLGAAITAGVLLDRGARVLVVSAASIALILACLMLNGNPPPGISAAWCYTAGVSLYSSVLVEYPARSARPGVAAAVFVVAGWMGSALGIGMAQDLHRVPLAFVLTASVAIFSALAWQCRALRAGVVALIALVGITANVRAATNEAALVLRGREVYIAEGCIHCHSQFIRPQASLDVERWGPAVALSTSLAATPPLFGTRRQGPDLANVGNRRTPEWNRLHLCNPRSVSPGSRMPSYRYLFSVDDDRGEALLAYLASLGADTIPQRLAQIAAWTPTNFIVLPPVEARGRFLQLCAQCHGEEGHGDGALAGSLRDSPPDWARTMWRHVPPGGDPTVYLSRIIKFGLSGLPMAGHEYLPDADIAGLARYVQTLHKDQNKGAAVTSPANEDFNRRR